MPNARQIAAVITIMLLLICEGSTGAGEFQDPSGFSFTHPDDWTAVRISDKGVVSQNLPPEINRWLKKNNLDLNISVVLLRNGKEDFLENVNVNIIRQQIPISSDTIKMLTEVVPKQIESMGGKVDGYQLHIQKIGAQDVLVAEYITVLPGVPQRLKQKQVMIPGNGNTFVVTCTALPETHAQYAAIFDSILASFQVSGPIRSGSGINWKTVLNTALIGGIAGGVIGAAAYLGKWIFKTKK